jgi:hypothetical protein
VKALASPLRPRGQGREGTIFPFGEAEAVLAWLAHGRHIAHVGARTADVTDHELQRAADAGIGAIARPEAVGAGVDAQRARDWAMDAERHASGAGGRGDAEDVEVGFEDRFGRGQHDRQFLGQRAGDHALVGDSLGRELAEHRRQHAARLGAIGNAGDHGIEPSLRRRYKRQAVAELCVSKDLLGSFPARRLLDDGPAAPLAHWMRVQATMVPPNDGMNAECLPGPPATVMCRSCGVRPMRK